jgi:hypothetical protein
MNPPINAVALRQLARIWALFLILSSLLWPSFVPAARAALQFDVFLGYDQIVPEACWFPIVCEINNDGLPFNGVIEVSSEHFNQGQVRRVAVELPTGTLKRLVIPVFASTRGYASWDVRLFDERGKLRAEQTGQRPRKQITAETPLMGALPRTAGGTPVIRPILPKSAELQPAAARLQPSIFPDNPLVLEGMDSLYLNSEKASELKDTQVNALIAWLNAGGHLIVAVEQVSDVAASRWLRGLISCELKDIKTITGHPELQQWLRTGGTAQSSFTLRSRPPPRTQPSSLAVSNAFGDLADDFTFEAAPLQVATGTIREGQVVVSAGDTPLILTANRGRGRVTTLLFSPEREPVRSWKNLPTFWAKLMEVPEVLYLVSDFVQPGWAPSSDGIFGAMIDTRQVHKLPVEWLLLLLVVYLVVIGPLDQFWLKRINRPMLTWITFPCYVVLFSLLIYFIGYKLRAGESEWNELHLVDVFLSGGKAELRGRSYASVYAPANQKYDLASSEKFATLRGEFLGGYVGGQSTEKASVFQVGDSFKAEIFVPVWTSQLLVHDWWHTAPVPISVTATNLGDQWQVTVDNRTGQKLSNAQIAIDNVILSLGELPAKDSKTFTLAKRTGVGINDFVSRYGQAFYGAVQSRQRAFGGTESGRLDDRFNSTIAASFLSQMKNQESYMGSFVAPPGLDLSATARNGNAILFAWAADHSPIAALNKFSPRRFHQDTMYRVAVEIQ